MIDEIKDLRASVQAEFREVKGAIKKVADMVMLDSQRVGVLENRMNRYDSGARRMSEEAKEQKEMLTLIQEQNSRQLLNQAVADARRDEMAKLIKWAVASGIPVAVAILGGLVWLIQHVGAK